jgi:hypothetical protein
MIKRYLILFGWIALLFFLMSCAASRLDMDFGNSSRLSKINQIHNPEAEQNIEPVYGLDGEAAQANTEKYRKDFEKSPPPIPSTLTIGISGSGKK